MNIETRGSTDRTKRLIELLMERGVSDRRDEWLTASMFRDIGASEMEWPVDELPPYIISADGRPVCQGGNGKGLTPAVDPEEVPLIIRRAKASAELIDALIYPENSKVTRTYEIQPGELIVGVIPMGSLGFGKVFPNYLSQDEKYIAFFSNRGIDSVLAHNVPDHKRVLEKGLGHIIDYCDERLASLQKELKYPLGENEWIKYKMEFYYAVRICCRAAIKYANAYADLAEKMADDEKDRGRRQELIRIAEICRKVPEHPADTFHEAVQSVFFIHQFLHATVSHISLGRMDQYLQPYLEKSLEAGDIDEAGAVELFECFWVKAAGRLTLTTEYIVDQDHTEFSTAMGHNPFLVDQEVSINQFMQNIVIGGQTREGEDATNLCSKLILAAYKNVNLPTPVLNARIHSGSPRDYLDQVARTLVETGSGQPAVYNDEVIIPGLTSDKVPVEEARDYVIDGCWEALLNAKCDFNYNMINLLPVLECALNRGALIKNSKMQLRGPKMSFLSTPPDEIKTFEELQDVFKEHLQYFVNRCAMELYSFYSLEGSVTPAPFFSALLGRCLENGIDKTWGGADYQMGSVVFIAMPNCANSLMALKDWVFDESKPTGERYKLSKVVDALRHNFKGDNKMLTKFKSSAKYGNNNPEVDGIMAWLTDATSAAVKEAEKLCDEVFLNDEPDPEKARRIWRLRYMTGYDGPSMKKRYGDDFQIALCAGAGTFELFVFFGQNYAASPDGRRENMPVAPNASPASGTAKNGVGSALESLKGLGLERFGTGVVTDLCLDREVAGPDLIGRVLETFVENKGSILTLTVVGSEQIEKICKLCENVRAGKADYSELDEHCHVMVRVAGWNSSFVTLTQGHQEDYKERVISRK